MATSADEGASTDMVLEYNKPFGLFKHPVSQEAEDRRHGRSNRIDYDSRNAVSRENIARIDGDCSHVLTSLSARQRPKTPAKNDLHHSTVQSCMRMNVT